MADFSDLLWNDSGSSKPKPAATTLGNGLADRSSAPSQARSRTAVRPYDTFSALASTTSSSRSTYSRTNTNTHGSTGYTAQSSKPSAAPSPGPTNSSTVDAFGSLFSSGPGASGAASSTTSLSIAQQQARLAQQKQELSRKQGISQPSDQGAFWDSFESGGSASPVGSSRSSKYASAVSPAPSSSLLQPTSRSGSAASAQKATNNSPLSSDPWGDFDTLAPPNTTVNAPTPARVTKSAVDDLFDLGEFERQLPSTASQSKSNSPVSRPASPGDFDFGNREYSGDRLLNGDNSDEDDILGDLAKPIDQLPSRTASRASMQSRASLQSNGNDDSQPNRRAPVSRAISPPPHIVGQIVEMGFSVQQARIALAATDTGIDVEAALDTLLNNVGAENANASAELDGGRGGMSDEEAWERREEERERRRRRPRRNVAPATSSSAGPHAPHRRQQATGRDPSLAAADGGPQGQPAGASDTAAQLRDQADKYLSQASEIGLNVLKSANSFWSSGKAQLQKAYEERRAAAAASGSSNAASSNKNMRPRWAQGDVEHDLEDDPTTPRPTGGFKDDEDDAQEESCPGESTSQAPPVMPKRPRSSKKQQLEVDLFAHASGERSRPYQSPHRRRPAVGLMPPSSSSSSSGVLPLRTQTQPPSTAIRPPSPLHKRVIVSASPSTLAQCKSHRSRGTEMFKLGRFAEAEAAYGNAIAVLPKGHLVLVPLLNNRAAARLKVGEHKGAAEDCCIVLNMIEPASDDIAADEGRRYYHPSREELIPPMEDGEVVSLAEGYVKALQRRAQAYESAEKWTLAKADWERLVGVDWPAGLRVRQEAVRGIGRCRQMLGGGGGDTAGGANGAKSSSARDTLKQPVAARKRRPTEQRTSLGIVANSSGVAKLRAQADTQEAEDGERVRIKDSVDARLIAWRGGKEGNLRALIASLENVLWPELGWTKVGMHELVTPAQVKVKYMRAIGRVHPDKLSAMNTTLEQRMIANGVFGALNEAWNTFKP